MNLIEVSPEIRPNIRRSAPPHPSPFLSHFLHAIVLLFFLPFHCKYKAKVQNSGGVCVLLSPRLLPSAVNTGFHFPVNQTKHASLHATASVPSLRVAFQFQFVSLNFFLTPRVASHKEQREQFMILFSIRGYS